jgi:hypothetical protein
VDVHRVAAANCGKTLAQASWAIHYYIPVSVIAAAGGNEFVVRTRVGWRLWAIGAALASRAGTARRTASSGCGSGTGYGRVSIL